MIDQYLAVVALAVFIGLPALLLLAAMVKVAATTLRVTSEPDFVFVATHWLACAPVDDIEVMIDEDGNVLCEQHFTKEILQLDHVDNINPKRLWPIGEKR